MADHVEQIKSRLHIEDIVGGYIKLQKSGVNFKACCPFHNEKTPSFYVTPERQIWHCFGCSKGGDMFSFVEEIEGVEFPEALRILAAKAGVEVDRFDPTVKNAKTSLYNICELATKFFEKQLTHSLTGQKAMIYLKDRGMTEQTINDFRLGFAPNDWHALTTFLITSGGFSEKEVVDAGLAIKRQPTLLRQGFGGQASDKRQEGTYDRFRSRITFPIFDVHGQVVGFTARIFEVENTKSDKQKVKSEKGESVVAKYINTPQTLIYDKSRVLYGLAQSKTDIKQADSCLLVEGNMDALMSYQAGVRNVVATSGTALTGEQLALLKRYTRNLHFCFDTDQAGASATRRGIGLALSQDFSINVVQIQDPECKDPADYVRKYGVAWRTVAEDAKPVIQFYFDRAMTGYNPSSADSKKSVIGLVGPFIKRLTSRVEQAHWVNQLASVLRVGEEAVRADIVSVHDDIETYAQRAAVASTVTPHQAVTGEPLDVLQEMFLALVLKNPALVRDDLRNMPMEVLDPYVVAVCAKVLLSSDSQAVDVDQLLKSADPENVFRIEFAYLRSQEVWNGFTDAQLMDEFRSVFKKIRARSIAVKLNNLQFDIREAESKNNTTRLQELAAQFMVLTKELAEIQKQLFNNEKTSQEISQA